MAVQQLVFFILALVTVAAALVVILGRNIVHAALSLVLAFCGVAGLYVLLDAEFLAAVQILLYVGGITILILFAIMLTSRISARGVRILNEQVWVGLVVVGGLLFLILGYVIPKFPYPASPPPPVMTIPSIGRLLMTTYVLPFEVASILLLVALIGAIILARRGNGQSPTLSPSEKGKEQE